VLFMFVFFSVLFLLFYQFYPVLDKLIDWLTDNWETKNLPQKKLWNWNSKIIHNKKMVY